MIKTAVILAAGCGSRISSKTKGKPKGFLSVGEDSIVEQSIGKLISCGIDQIIVGTGYGNEQYETLAKANPFVRCEYNGKYAESGSMYTLYRLKKYLPDDDFLLLESDLLYEINSLKVLINDRCENVILASGRTESGDEVYIEADGNNNLVNMSKNQGNLSVIYGELVGLTKLSNTAYEHMCQYAEMVFRENLKLEYEDALVGVSKAIEIKVNRINELAWCEIDDENHLQRAIDQVYPRIVERESMLKVKKNILLNPGPATTTDSVKYAQVVPDICPREKEFGDIMKYVSEELTNIVANNEDYTTVLFGGSGTAAVESMLTSTIDDSDCVLIINNGAYGKRMCEIASAYNIDYLEYKLEPDLPIEMDLLKRYIEDHTNITQVAVVHHETTTGLLNDIQEIGDLCKVREIGLIVDAISSYAAIPIDMESMNISFMAASSNKNLQGMAGISFVVANKKALKKCKGKTARNYYLNLFSQYEYFINNYQMRFTPPVQVVYALRQAIIETIHEGVQHRYDRYQKSWECLLEGMERLGFKYCLPRNNQSRLITSFLEPDAEWYSFDVMHEFFLRRGFTIYPGKILKTKTFRVANIGNISYKNIEMFLSVMEEFLNKVNHKH